MSCIGVDIIEISRIGKAIDRWGEIFLRRVYSEAELNLCQGRLSSLAARFAGKEAAIKALSQNGGIFLRDIEILAGPGGKPLINLTGRARETAKDLGLRELRVSLSHSRDNAIAFVIGTR
ncbi:MAG: holo-ACP synthase [Chloroflexi bacterium]|nr:holo-ACP synthase [Chloroflexota bacterium]